MAAGSFAVAAVRDHLELKSRAGPLPQVRITQREREVLLVLTVAMRTVLTPPLDPSEREGRRVIVGGELIAAPVSLIADVDVELVRELARVLIDEGPDEPFLEAPADGLVDLLRPDEGRLWRELVVFDLDRLLLRCPRRARHDSERDQCCAKPMHRIPLEGAAEQITTICRSRQRGRAPRPATTGKS